MSIGGLLRLLVIVLQFFLMLQQKAFLTQACRVAGSTAGASNCMAMYADPMPLKTVRYFTKCTINVYFHIPYSLQIRCS